MNDSMRCTQFAYVHACVADSRCWLFLSCTCLSSVGEEQLQFGLSTVELSQKHASSPVENKKTVSSLIHSVISNSTGADAAAVGGSVASKLAMEKEIEVEVAKQEESYTTLFEKDTVRPFVASYQKVTETELSLHVAPISAASSSAPSSSSSAATSPKSPASPVLHQITQQEFKNSRHVFIWSDVPQLSTKDYIQSVYQNYLDAANTAYAELKAEKEGHTAGRK
jgi:urate oxidase